MSFKSFFTGLFGWVENTGFWRRLKAEKAVLENETIDPKPRSAWAWLEIFVVVTAGVLTLVYAGFVIGKVHGRHDVLVQVQEKTVSVIPDGLVSVKALEVWKSKYGQCDKDLALANEKIGQDPPSPPPGKAPKLLIMPLVSPDPVPVAIDPVVVEQPPAAAAKPKHVGAKPCAKNDGWCSLTVTVNKTVKSVSKSVGAN